jgi:hypothetical protein
MRNHIVLKFDKCRGCNRKEDIKNTLNVLLAHGITLASNHREPGGKPQTIRFEGTVEEYLNEKVKEVELIDDDKTPISDRRGPFRFWGEGLLEDVDILGRRMRLCFGFDTFGKEFNMFDISFITTEEKLDTHSEFLYNLAIELYQVLLPSFGYIDYADAMGQDFFEEFPAYRTESLHWVTFFGFDFVSEYGQEYFEESPVWKKQALLDGGFILQLSRNLRYPEKYIDMDDVSSYFSPLGVKYVLWPKASEYY